MSRSHPHLDHNGRHPAVLLVGVQRAYRCTGHRAAGPHPVPHRHQAGRHTEKHPGNTSYLFCTPLIYTY